MSIQSCGLVLDWYLTSTEREIMTELFLAAPVGRLCLIWPEIQANSSVMLHYLIMHMNHNDLYTAQ